MDKLLKVLKIAATMAKFLFWLAKLIVVLMMSF